jgi:purine-binding chemotaxis protein CheW
MNSEEMLQFLTLRLEDEVFAIEINKVREVIDITDITKIPRTPEFMIGVVNLRGNIVPIVDLKQRLGMKSVDRTPDTCIVTIEIAYQEETIVVGALADSVQEVLEIPQAAIGPAPKIGIKLKPEFLKGIGKRRDRFIMILDMDRVLSEEALFIGDDLTTALPDKALSNGNETHIWP